MEESKSRRWFSARPWRASLICLAIAVLVGSITPMRATIGVPLDRAIGEVVYKTAFVMAIIYALVGFGRCDLR